MHAAHNPVDNGRIGSGLTRRLAAILMTDIVGYSRMMAEDQTRTVSLLRQWRDGDDFEREIRRS